MPHPADEKPGDVEDSAEAIQPSALLSPPTSRTDADDSPPPDGGYGWVCCLAVTGINGFIWGNLASYGVYLSYYIDHADLYGGTAFQYAFIGGINFAAAMLAAPFTNILIRRYGTKTPMYIGLVLWLAGWLSASFASRYWQLFLSQGLLVGIGAGMNWLPAAPVLPQWFLRKRSLVQGIASSGSGTIGVIYSVATVPMIDTLGLGWSLRITGITSTVVLLACTYVLRDRNRDLKAVIKPFDMALLKNSQVWLLSGYTLFTTLGYMVVINSFSAFAVSLGYSQTQGGNIVAILNAGTALGRPLIGVVSDRIGRITTACILTAANVVLAFAFWIPTTTYPPLIVLALIYGGTCGVFWATIAPLSAEVVPLQHLASLLCLQWLTVSLPSLFSQAIALEIRQDPRGPGGRRWVFLYPQIYTGLTYAIGALFLLELRRRRVGLFGRERHAGMAAKKDAPAQQHEGDDVDGIRV